MANLEIGDIRTLIAKGDLGKAVEALFDHFSDHTHKDQVTAISGRYHSLEKRKIMGVLSGEQITVEQNRIMASLLELVNQLEEVDQSRRRLANVSQALDERAQVEKLLEILQQTDQGFKDQCKIRNRLYAAVKSRLAVKDHLQYEEFFDTYFPDMNEEEKALHQTIRSYTEKILHAYNRKALELILGNEDLLEAIPRLKELERHLLVWLGKYEYLFHRVPSKALIYTGVKEKVPFPAHIEAELEAYLQNPA